MARALTESQVLERSILTEFRDELWGPFNKAIRRYSLIEPGDRVLTVVRAEAEALLMAKELQEYARHSGVGFTALFAAADEAGTEAALRFGLALTELSGECQKSAPPVWAKALSCNKLADVLCMEDVTETVLGQMLYRGVLEACPPMEDSGTPGVRLIRPLYRTERARLEQWAQTRGLPCLLRSKPSERERARVLIERLKQADPHIEVSLFGSVHDVETGTLPGYTSSWGGTSIS
ncbi:MAG: hypothetical protein IJ240_03760 [Clostridia bacterium]|nr:hypothetical protein [Clostridia bacterium]